MTTFFKNITSCPRSITISIYINASVSFSYTSTLHQSNENDIMASSDTEIRVRVATEITDEERLITDDLKALMIRN